MRLQPVVRSRTACRLALLAATAILLTGCADSSRFGDPLGNPFQSASADHIDRAPTGTVQKPRMASNEKIVGQPLSAPGASPAPTYSPPQPAPAAASQAAASGNWIAAGGTPVVVAEGESAKILSDRYGIPVDALVRTNGFNTAAQIQPGTKLVIPVYSTARAATPRAEPKSAAAAQAKPKPMPVARVEPKPAPARAAQDDHHGRETLRLVKGPQPAKPGKAADAAPAPKNAHEAKAKLMERGKVAKKDETQPKPRPEVAQRAPEPKKVAPKQEARVEPPVVKPLAVTPKTAKNEGAKPGIDPAPTASLPPPQADSSKAEKAADKSADAANPEFRWPARGRVIQGFKSGGNDGINIALPEGTPVKAAEDGVVAYAGSELKGYGNLVLIRHPNGYVSAYANNGSLDVKRGDSVKRGQTIAKSGQSGNVSSPQLHFELRKGAQPVDPSGYLAGL